MSVPDAPPPQRQPFLNAPASVVVLIAILAAVHAARALSPAFDQLALAYVLDPVVYSAQALRALGAGVPDLADYVVPPFSHIFLHANLVHLAVNSIWLLAFGPVIARRFGGFAFYLFFLLCGLGGAMAFVALDWGQNIGAIGASGAISGLMGGAIRLIRVGGFGLDTAPLQPLWSRPVLSFSAVWIVINLIAGVFNIGTFGAAEAIAWQDHLGGYLAGLLLVAPFEHYFGYAARLRRAGA